MIGIQFEWHECLVCGDTIASQVCYRCMQGEVERWMEKESPSYTGSVRRVGEFFDTYRHEGASCVSCGENVNVCGECYSLAVHKALRRNRILASEFLDFAADRGFLVASAKGVLKLER